MKLGATPNGKNIFIFGCMILAAGCAKENAPAPVKSTSKDISAVVFTKADNPNLPTDITGTFSGDSIKIPFPQGIPLNNLVSIITITGASVSPTSKTAQNFDSPVSYTVKAEDGSTKRYVISATPRLPIDTAQAITGRWSVYKDSSSNIGNFYFILNGITYVPNAGVYWGVSADYYDFLSNGILNMHENNNTYTGIQYQVRPNSRLYMFEVSEAYDDGIILEISFNRLTIYWGKNSPNGGRWDRKLYLRK